MAHSSLAALQAAATDETILKLLDDDADGAVDAGPLAYVLDGADEEIRRRMGRTYTAEDFAKPGISLTEIATDIAIELAYLRHPELFNRNGETPWHARYQKACATLADVAKTQVRLDKDGSGRGRPRNVGGRRAARRRYFTGPSGTGDY